MRHLNRAGTCAVALAAGLAVVFLQAGATAQDSSAPRYKFDPDWSRSVRVTIYIKGEVFAGQRIQRFVPAGSPRGKLLEQLSSIR